MEVFGAWPASAHSEPVLALLGTAAPQRHDCAGVQADGRLRPRPFRRPVADPTTGILGESESCKTWFAVAAAAEVLEDGRVLWIDYEDDDRTVVARLRAVGAHDDAIVERFTYLRPDEPLQDRHSRWTNGGLDFTNPIDSASYDGSSQRRITENVEGKTDAIRDALRWLTDRPAAGCVSRRKASHTFTG
jgi:hypothetical protein